ncbi:glycerate kinase, partial [Embleya sp. NPDC059213]
GTVLDLAHHGAGVPVALVAGSVAVPPPPGVVATTDLTRLAGSAAAARTEAAHWLDRAGAALAGRFDVDGAVRRR